MAIVTCPQCGTSLSDTDTACPKCGYLVKKAGRGRALYAITGIVAIIAIALIVLVTIQPLPTSLSFPFHEVTTTSLAHPETPVCTIVIESDRITGNQIELRYKTGDCPVTELAVFINNKEHGTLNPQAGSSATFQGNAGTNTVMVIARFSNGSSGVVYQKLL
jgi:hypothetical protein